MEEVIVSEQVSYVYIDTGTEFVKAIPYIDNGTEFKAACAYIDDGTAFKICG